MESSYIKMNLQVAFNFDKLCNVSLRTLEEEHGFYVSDAIYFVHSSGVSWSYEDSKGKPLVFYTIQTEGHGYLLGRMHLTFGKEDAEDEVVVAIGKTIVKVLEADGFKCKWDSRADQSIEVDMKSLMYELDESDEKPSVDVAFKVPVIHAEEFKPITDEYGYNQDDNENFHFYFPMNEGESVDDVIKRLNNEVDCMKINAYKRCFYIHDTISPLEAWMEVEEGDMELE